jgi:hypothetical protein
MDNPLASNEQSAWDLYFCAALPVAKENGLPTGKGLDAQWVEAARLAATIADVMIQERRLREPNP